MSTPTSMNSAITEQKMLVISMRHIPQADQDTIKRLLAPETSLDDSDRPHWWFASSVESFTAYPAFGGWLLQIHNPTGLSDGARLLFTDYFYTVLRWAIRRGATWLRLDVDAPVIHDLQVYFS